MSVTLDRILEKKLVAIARRIPEAMLVDVARAMMAGGIACLETTFDQSAADPIALNRRMIAALVRTFGDRLCVGAGTVLTVAQVQAACEAGATYIISPNTNAAVIAETKRLGLVSIPGAMTPTEMDFAYQSGADLVKLFPADDLGCHYIRNITSPLSHIPFILTGGVNPETIPEFLATGAKGVATGVSIMKPELVASRDFAAIAQLAREHVLAVETFISKHR